jgi:hypothetical protein
LGGPRKRTLSAIARFDQAFGGKYNASEKETAEKNY